MRSLQFDGGLNGEQMLTKSSSFERLMSDTNTYRSNIISALDNKDFETANQLQDNYIHSLSQFTTVSSEIRAVAELAMQYFFFELTAEGESENQIQKKLLKKAEKLPKLSRVWIKLKQSLILSTSLLQIELKLIIVNRIRVSIDDLLMLENMVRQMVKIHPVSTKYSKFAMTIISHLNVYKLNTLATHQQKLTEICKALIREEEAPIKLLTLQTKIALLYNCLKTVLGMKAMSSNGQEVLLKMYEAFRVKSVFKYEQHLLHLFFIIKGQISRKGQALEGVEEVNKEQQEQAVVDRGVAQKLSVWTSVSLDQTSLALEEATRSIIRHRVASLATIIGMKLGLPRFCLSFLELMHDSPFNNQAQTIKLCFQLFQARDYQKLNACLQTVLSSPSCKNLREREVLLSMCGIFTGIYLNDRQGALMYAKLNHHQNKKLILCEQTLLQHVGMAYLNLAIHELYSSNREVFERQALESFKASAAVNPKNYLTQYCLGKLMLRMGNYEEAYLHSKESLMNGRGEWMPFCLLACVYFSERKFSKAMAIIDQLLKKYHGVNTLYYIRAYLEVNHLLLEVQYDEEVEAARELGDNIYQLAKERVLKNKSPANLLRFCQHYHQLSLKIGFTDFDENYFTHIPSLNHHEGGMMQTFAVGYQEAQGENAILQIIPLLLEAGQIYLAEGLIKSLPSSPSKNYQVLIDLSKKASLHQTKGEKDKAITLYKAVLSQQPYHTHSLIKLAMLEEDIGDALHYINLAEKFTSSNQLKLAKGVVLSRLGKIEEAYELFLKEGETGWLDMQPDLLYYY